MLKIMLKCHFLIVPNSKLSWYTNRKVLCTICNTHIICTSFTINGHHFVCYSNPIADVTTNISYMSERAAILNYAKNHLLDEMDRQLKLFISKTKNKKIKNADDWKVKSLAKVLKGSYDTKVIEEIIEFVKRDPDLVKKIADWVVSHPDMLDVNVAQAVSEAGIKDVVK